MPSENKQINSKWYFFLFINCREIHLEYTQWTVLCIILWTVHTSTSSILSIKYCSIWASQPLTYTIWSIAAPKYSIGHVFFLAYWQLPRSGQNMISSRSSYFSMSCFDCIVQCTWKFPNKLSFTVVKKYSSVELTFVCLFMQSNERMNVFLKLYEHMFLICVH